MEYNLNNSWKKDKQVILFIINFMFVIVGYGLAGVTGTASNAIVQPLKVIVLGYSIYSLLQIPSDTFVNDKSDNDLFLITNFLITLTIFLSLDFFQTLSRTFQLLIPFFYIFLFDRYLRYRYSKNEIIEYFIKVINITYSLPILSFYFFGGSLKATDIYGEVVGGFVSNHYGWSSLMFILSFADLYFNKKVQSYHKWFGLILILPAFYLLLISGNRASYLSFAIVLVIFLLRNSKIPFLLKLFFILISIFYITNELENPNSSLSERWLKTQQQLEDEEEFADTRSTARKIGWGVMDAHPETYLTGFGLFGFREAVMFYDPSTNFNLIRTGVHNSYFELLFGCGWIVFGIFFIFYIVKPLWNYLRYYSSQYLFVLPVFIIPFFESNLGGGQFLFYPWFASIFLFRK